MDQDTAIQLLLAGSGVPIPRSDPRRTPAARENDARIQALEGLGMLKTAPPHEITSEDERYVDNRPWHMRLPKYDAVAEEYAKGAIHPQGFLEIDP